MRIVSWNINSVRLRENLVLADERTRPGHYLPAGNQMPE